MEKEIAQLHYFYRQGFRYPPGAEPLRGTCNAENGNEARISVIE